MAFGSQAVLQGFWEDKTTYSTNLRYNNHGAVSQHYALFVYMLKISESKDIKWL